MRLRFLYLALLLTAFTARVSAGSESEISGRWVGDARLFDKHIRSLTGPLPVDLYVLPDFTLKGRIGDAEVPPTKPTSTTEKRVEYRIALAKPVKDIPDLNKLSLLVIITRGSRAGLDADFHLKSKFGFDPTMRVGHFDATRAEK